MSTGVILTLFFTGLLIVLSIPTFLLVSWQRIRYAKILCPEVKKLKQANQVLKTANALVFQATGMYYQNIYDIKSILIMSNNFPIKLMDDSKVLNPQPSSVKMSQEDIAKLLKEKSAEELINIMFDKYNLPKDVLNLEDMKLDEGKPAKKASEVYSRIRAMKVMALFVFEMTRNRNKKAICEKYKKMVQDYSVKLSEFEKEALRPDVSEIELMQISWYIEATYIFEMILGYVEKYYLPSEPADISNWMPTKEEIANLKIDESLAEKLMKLYFAYAWTIHEQMLNGRNVNLISDIVFERYKALLWIYDEEESEYNNIEVDT